MVSPGQGTSLDDDANAMSQSHIGDGCDQVGRGVLLRGPHFATIGPGSWILGNGERQTSR